MPVRTYRMERTHKADWTDCTDRTTGQTAELEGQKNRTDKVEGNRGGHLKLSQRNAALEDWKLVREDDKPDGKRAEKTGRHDGAKESTGKPTS
jgi:hypothetical protein